VQYEKEEQRRELDKKIALRDCEVQTGKEHTTDSTQVYNMKYRQVSNNTIGLQVYWDVVKPS